jgi:hypothetical protein
VWSALMLISFAVVHFPFIVSVYFSVPSLLIISERKYGRYFLRYQDYLDALECAGKEIASKAYILEGGVKAWNARFCGDEGT